MIVARRLHSLMGLPTGKLEDWEKTEGVKGPDGNGQTFSFGAYGAGIRLYCEIRGTGGHFAPWSLGFEAAWLTERDYKELKKQKVSVPEVLFKEAALIDLDPPSGKRYTMKEDFRLYQEKLGIKEDPPPAPWRPANPPVKEAEEPKASAARRESETSGDFLWLWVGSALTATAVAYWLVKRRQGKRRK